MTAPITFIAAIMALLSAFAIYSQGTKPVVAVVGFGAVVAFISIYFGESLLHMIVPIALFFTLLPLFRATLAKTRSTI